jgi:mannosyltransferase OCH1-like enzyme
MSLDCQVPNIVHIFWHGSPLPYFQRHAIRSWMNYGWSVHYWSYESEDAPEGAVWRDASTLYPVSMVYSISQGEAMASIAAFSDLFRYTVLSLEPGLWSDADNFCLRHYDEWAPMMSGRRVICGQEFEDDFSVATGVLGFPDGAVCEVALTRCREMISSHESRLPSWAIIGPRLMTSIISELSLQADVLPIEAFYPIPIHEHRRIIEPSETDDLRETVSGSYSFHFWNSQFTPYSELTDVAPPSGSLLEWVIQELCY